MSLQPYQFEPNSGQLTEQTDGTWVATASLSAHVEEHFTYNAKGLNTNNQYEIIVKIEGDASGFIGNHPVQTSSFSRPATATEVLLVAEKDGKDRSTITMDFPDA